MILLSLDPTIVSMMFLNIFYIYSPTYFFVITVLLIELNSILTSKFNETSYETSILDLPSFIYFKIYKKFIQEELTEMEKLIFYIIFFVFSLQISTKTILLITANVSLIVKRNYTEIWYFFNSMKNYGKITYEQMRDLDCGAILSSSQSFIMEKCSPTIARVNMKDVSESEEVLLENNVLITSDLELEIPFLDDTLEGNVSYIFGEETLRHDDSVVGKLNSTRLKSYSARALNLMSSLDTTIESNPSTDDSFDPDYLPPLRPQRPRLHTTDLTGRSKNKRRLKRRNTYASPQEIERPVTRKVGRKVKI